MNKNKRLFFILFTVALLLCIPLIAMQFTNEVKWTIADFVAAAVLLFGCGISLEFVFRKVKSIRYRAIISIAIIATLIIVWLELAVGIFGTILCNL